MLDSKKITIIIPTHNSEKYIEECVRSAMNQTYKNVEIICVDSSNDNTLSILEKMKEEDPRICIFEDANSSYGHKLNVGIKQASGDYIAILESDDYVLPDMYEIMLKDLEEDVDYIKGAVYNFADVSGKRRFCLEDRGQIEKNFDRIIDLEKDRGLAFLSLPMIWAAIYRKDFLIEKDIWANETPGASYQDTSFTLAVAFLAKKCLFKQNAGYCYRNDNQNSSVKSKSKVFCVCDEYRYLEQILKKQGRYSKEVHIRVLRQKLVSYAWNVLRLDEVMAREFCQGIKSELCEYTEDIISLLSAVEKKYLDILNSEDALKIYGQNQDNIQLLWDKVTHVLKEKKCVLIGAGVIGKNILELQGWLELESICAVGDNNYMQLRNSLDRYAVLSIEEAVSRHSKETFIVASKNYDMDIVNQLIDLGVSTEQIMVVNKSIGKRELLCKCI